MAAAQHKAASFGEKLRGMLADYNKSFEDYYGVDIRLPRNMGTLRQMLIASAVGGGLGLGRGVFWPGYIEEKDEQGRIVAKRKRSPLMGALEGAAIGAGTSALSSYASQTLSQYNPEIDKLLQGAKKQIASIVNPTKTPWQGVDFNPEQNTALAGRV